MAKRKKKTPRKKLEEKLDALCREAIMFRDGHCVKCGKTFDKLDCSHVIPRGNKRLRWDLLNLKNLCSGCHMWWWHQNPIEARNWFKDTFPDRYAYLLKEQSEGPKRWGLQELEDYVIYLEERIEFLNKTDENNSPF